jgi:hypothetical protein
VQSLKQEEGKHHDKYVLDRKNLAFRSGYDEQKVKD